MRRPWIGLIVVVILIAGAISAAWYWGGDGDWGPRHHEEITRIVNPDGSAVANGQTVVIETHRGGPFFFPFGFFFVILLFFLISRLFFWGRGGRRWNGPGPGGPPPAWFDEWHRQAHSHEQTPAPDTTRDAQPDESHQGETR